MREIKFRAWIKNENIMSNCNSFQSINFDITGGVESIINVMVGVESRISNDGEYYPEQYQYLDKFLSGEFDLMQYTGLKDKNGKEIYEGDIIIHNGNQYVIRYSDNLGIIALATTKEYDSFSGLVKRNHRYREQAWLHNVQKYLSVIGNIYENPELLKGDLK